jgi:hypothetical protein
MKQKGDIPMKEFQLSTSSERTVSCAFVAAMAVCFGILLYSLRESMTLMIGCAVATALITVLLAISAVGTVKAACVADTEKKTVEVKGFPSYTVDISKAVQLQTLPRKNGQATTRVLVFSDDDDQIVATIPTMFTFKQGMMAEPMAEEMAAVLGLRFKRNIPEWEFDKKLYEEHQKQVAAEERAAAKERREARMRQRINKRKKEMNKK